LRAAFAASGLLSVSLLDYDKTAAGTGLEHLGEIVDTVCREMQAHLGHGRVADYIPALARIDPRHFGIAVAVHGGGDRAPIRMFAAGDATTAFSVQSISEVFALTMALERLGGTLWKRVGREPSGSPFNSIVQLENEHGVPRNPLINAGALVVTDALLAAGDPARLIADILDFTRMIADDPAVTIDAEVARSEAETGFRNASLANFLRAFGNIESDVQDVLQVYFHQCALRMNCRQLARAGLYLAHDGIDPRDGLDPHRAKRITTLQRARRINALMMTCGHYDASGDFAFRVGLPGKSGVGGGILAIAPHRASIAVWSPGLNAWGNSHVGVLALERLASLTKWSVF
jgi:glutaminase